jgi:hypothetical protein
MLRDGENHLDEVLCVSVAGSEGIPDLVLDTLEPASQCNAANNKEPVKVMVGIKEPTQKAQKTHLKNPLKMFEKPTIKRMLIVIHRQLYT